MYTDRQLGELGFFRKGRERHLIIGPYSHKLAWPDQITGNHIRPRLIIRGRWLFFVENATWREMNRYDYNDQHRFRTLWKCARMKLPMQAYKTVTYSTGSNMHSFDTPNWDEPSYRTLTELVEKVQAGGWPQQYEDVE